jgi:hypothetical protein
MQEHESTSSGQGRNGTGNGTGSGTDTWLERPSTLRGLWIAFAIVLALTVIAQFFVPIEGYFGLDGSFGFAALFGFLSCALMVVVAKLFNVLKRPERYYEDAAEQARRVAEEPREGQDD